MGCVLLGLSSNSHIYLIFRTLPRNEASYDDRPSPRFNMTYQHYVRYTSVS